MKRLWIATAAFVVFAVLGILWKTSVIQTEVVKSTVKGADIGTPAATPLAMPGVETVNRTPNRARVDDVRRIVEAANVPINFWGKVTDQDGLPLSGVLVTYACSIDHGNDQGVAWIEQEIQRGEIGSGADGSFSILGLKGHDLGIESLTKSGYVYKSRLNHSYNFYGDAPPGKFVASEGKPIIFAMIHKDRLEPLIQSKGEFHVNGDGTQEHWNLWNGEAEPNGELAIIFRADPGVSASPAQRANWSADLEVVGGGIIEALWEEEVHCAPEAGYLAVAAYPKSEQKRGVRHRSFYLRTADGKYGRIQVELSMSYDGRTAQCFITADMNPRPSSRNLEPSEEE